MAEAIYTPKRWQDLTVKDKVAYSTAVASFICGVILVFVALFIPPVGKIEPTVLTAFGTFLVYTAGILGVVFYVKDSRLEMQGYMKSKVEGYLTEYFNNKEKNDESK